MNTICKKITCPEFSFRYKTSALSLLLIQVQTSASSLLLIQVQTQGFLHDRLGCTNEQLKATHEPRLTMEKR